MPPPAPAMASASSFPSILTFVMALVVQEMTVRLGASLIGGTPS